MKTRYRIHRRWLSPDLVVLQVEYQRTASINGQIESWPAWRDMRPDEILEQPMETISVGNPGCWVTVQMCVPHYGETVEIIHVDGRTVETVVVGHSPWIDAVSDKGMAMVWRYPALKVEIKQ